MRTLDGLIQGSDQWLAERAKHHTASEASVMMGASSKATRNDLLRMKATGSEQEFSRWVLEVLFERGHQVEAAARPIAEGIIGEELYPTTGVDGDGVLLASFDGITLLEDVVWECKQWNAAKAAAVEAGTVPADDYWQIVQQLVVSRAERCLYMVTDGTEDGTVYTWLTLDADDEDRLHAGWKQFDDDLANYQPREDKPEAVGRTPENLPALRIEVEGAVTASNLAEFQDHALAVFEGINTDLQSDEDFASAEATVKWCKEVESKLDAAKDHALSQTASIDELFRSIDQIKEQARKKRLELDRLVKARKEAIRDEVRREAVDAIRAHYERLNGGIENALGVPADIGSEVAAAMKGKKTVRSLRDAADQVVADAKIAANEQAERIRANIARFVELTGDHTTLFPDRIQLVQKAPEDMEAAVKARIAEHEEKERQRLEAERERIRQEEARKAEQAKGAPESSGQASQGAPKTDDAREVVGAREQPAPDDGARIKLSDINARIAPLSISAAGLSHLGFEPASRDKAAKLYRASDFPAICDALIRHLKAAQQHADRSAA